MIYELNELEKSRAHVALVEALRIEGDSPRERGLRAWAYQVTHLDHRDVSENLRVADHILDLLYENGGFAEAFSVDLRQVKLICALDNTTAVNSLTLLGAVEGPPNTFSTGPGSRSVNITLKAA